MDPAPSQVSISNFPGDFSDPIDLDEFEIPRDAHPPSIGNEFPLGHVSWHQARKEG